MRFGDALKVTPVTKSRIHDGVIDRVKTGVIAIVGVEKRKNVNAVEVLQGTLEQLLNLGEVSSHALGVNENAGARHGFLL
jgi:hypothetical protein